MLLRRYTIQTSHVTQAEEAELISSVIRVPIQVSHSNYNTLVFFIWSIVAAATLGKQKESNKHVTTFTVFAGKCSHLKICCFIVSLF